MASKSATVVGVELQDTAIRAVQVAFRGGKGRVLGWNSLPLPDSAFQEGVIHDAAAVAIALRHLLESLGASGQAVVIGIAEKTQLRNLVVPPVPPDELGIVVDVEIEHQQVLRSAYSLYSYLPLASPKRTDRLVENVAVFTAGDEVFAALRSVVEHGDLRIAAVEPSVYAMHRAAWLSQANADVAFTVSIGSRFAEVGFVYRGDLVSYRRIDIGAKALLAGGAAPSAPSTAGDRVPEMPSPDARHINVNELDLLGTEIRRILDYLSREYDGLPAVEQIALAIETESLAPIADELAKSIGVPVTLVNPLAGHKGNSESPTHGSVFATAYGLAMQEAQAAERAAPQIDLYAQERLAKSDSESKKNLVGSMIVSGVAVALGVAAYMLYGFQINQTKAATENHLKNAAEIRSKTDMELAGRARREQQYRVLRREGVPVTSILSAVARNLDPDAGVSSITIDNNLKVTITGEALSEGPMIRSVQMLQQSPILKNLMIDSFSRQDTSQGINYQISATTVPLSQIALPDNPAGGTP